MHLTPEQIRVINSTGNIKINAVAGSGKTTTLIEYARSRPANSKILYLAFNRSVRLEAAQKFATRGLNNVHVETAHSLAYKNVVLKHGYKVRNQGYKPSEMADLLRLRAQREKHAHYVLANHINRFVTYYCNSSKSSILDLNYLEALPPGKAWHFAANAYKYIEKKAVALLEKMELKEIEITHDFYLKKFQLARPVLPYDYILFDEGQDASPAMLDVFLNQKATKVIVGDTNQQIYSWRHAINSLEQTTFESFNLTASFRFGKDLADLAQQTLRLKRYVGHSDAFNIRGLGSAKMIKTKAVIGRSNLGLLLRAIEMVTRDNPVKSLYFEGNISSCTYADDGTSLYDVLNLSNGKYHLIRDKAIRSMRYLNELEEYVKQTEDMQLGMMIEIVRAYGEQIPRIIQLIKSRHVSNEDKHMAEVIFSTVHRCKGMEYDEVHLLNDFITEDKLKKFMEGKNENLTAAKANEEINLLYVAVTRAKMRLYIPETILPRGFPSSDSVRIEKAMVAEDAPGALPARGKTYSVASKRKDNAKAYAPWDAEADHELRVLVREGMSSEKMAAHFGRTRGAIESRIKRLGLETYQRIWEKKVS
jgi:hypothetical protein